MKKRKKGRFIKTKNVYIDSYGQRLENIHEKTELCKTRGCCVHSPSKHNMVSWPTLWRSDDGVFMERICSHGVGHPDPDDLKYRLQFDKYAGVHGCDGCCSKTRALEKPTHNKCGCGGKKTIKAKKCIKCYHHPSGKIARNKEICKMRRRGKTYREIGEKYKITRERVRQIVAGIKGAGKKWARHDENRRLFNR